MGGRGGARRGVPAPPASLGIDWGWRVWCQQVSLLELFHVLFDTKDYPVKKGNKPGFVFPKWTKRKRSSIKITFRICTPNARNPASCSKPHLYDNNACHSDFPGVTCLWTVQTRSVSDHLQFKWVKACFVLTLHFLVLKIYWTSSQLHVREVPGA